MNDVKIYCEVCGVLRKPLIVMEKDTTHPEQGVWGDILCTDCNFVIATISGSVEGKYELTHVDEPVIKD